MKNADATVAAMPDPAPTQACPQCGTVIDLSAIEPLEKIACPQCGEKFRAEKSFDHFQLVETLGVGGMGSVYKARDTRLDRFVALKLLRKELSADPAEAARLEQEARLTAAVNHPHVVQVYSAGHAHDQIYLVMELVDHGSLDDLMAQKKRVPEADVLHAGIQVAKGLQAAHEKGLIHRDVKPANILFANAETAKIGDFGLAVTAGQHAEATREIWGTPYYVAPERLNNAPEDFRSDIYSLGATLFHALAGQPPIEGETTSASELRKLKSHPPDLRSIAPEISRGAARTIMRMIAPEPTQRFASYADLIRALEQAAAGEIASPPVREEKSRGPLVAVLGLLALAGAIGFVVYFKQPTPPLSGGESPTPSSSIAPRDDAAEKEKQAAAAAAAAAEKAAEAERQQLLAAETPAWEKARADARARIALYEFDAARTAIDAPSLSAPSLVEAQANARKKIDWLIAWKKQLIADLNTGGYTTVIKRPPEVEYEGVAGANELEIVLRVPGGRGGKAPFKWATFSKEELLDFSTRLIGDDPRQAYRRWLAAVFAAETGQTEQARALAEKAAQAKPEYAAQMSVLFPADDERPAATPAGADRTQTPPASPE